jgi:hypothetical protein
VIVFGPFEWKGICAGFLSFVYKCIVVDDPDNKRGFGIPLNGLTPPVIIYLQGGSKLF